MGKLILVPQEVAPMNEYGLTPGYGMVRFQREHTVKDCKEGAVGKVRETLVYNPALWDALRAKKKSSRQKRLIKETMRKG
jgi:hypothetical protein